MTVRGIQPEKVIFVGGCHGRSGTTLMKRLICAHQAVSSVTGGETRCWETVADLLPYIAEDESYYSPKFSSRAHVQFRNAVRERFGDTRPIQDALDRFASKVARSECRLPGEVRMRLVEPCSLASVYTALRVLLCELFLITLVDPAADHACEKTASNAQFVELIARVMPQARTVIMLRHPVDIALSHRSRDWGPNDPVEAARYTKAYLRAWLATSVRVQAGHHILVRHEELVREPVATMRAVGEFLGLALDPQAEAFARDVIRDPLNRQAGMPPATLEAMYSILRPELQELGYSCHPQHLAGTGLRNV